MPPVPRRLFTLCSALSLLLCLAVCVLWVRSYFVSDSAQVILQRTKEGKIARLGSATTHRGRVWLQGVRVHPRSAPGPWLRDDPVYWHTPPHRIVLTSVRFGFGVSRFSTTRPPAHVVNVIVPFWLVAVAGATAPSLQAVVFARTRRRRARGLCPACGYDLRASPGRCPECGAAAGGKESHTF